MDPGQAGGIETGDVVLGDADVPPPELFFELRDLRRELEVMLEERRRVLDVALDERRPDEDLVRLVRSDPGV